MSNLTTDWLYPAAALVCALAGAVFDVRSRRIPNFISLPGILFGLALHFSLGGWRQLGLSAAAGLICGLVFFVFWIAGGMGAGDVKLITAAGCIAGLPEVANLLILTAIAGGLMAVALAVWRGRLKETIMNVGALAVHHRFEGLRPHPELNIGNAGTLRLPYGVAIAAGSALTLCAAALRR